MDSYTTWMFKILKPTKKLVDAYNQQNGVAENGIANMNSKIEFLPITELTGSKTGKQLIQKYGDKLSIRRYSFDDNEAYLRESKFYKDLRKTKSDIEIMMEYQAVFTGCDSSGDTFNIHRIEDIDKGSNLVNVEPVAEFKSRSTYIRFEPIAGFYVSFIRAFPKRGIEKVCSLHPDFKGHTKNYEHIYVHTQTQLDALKSGVLDKFRSKGRWSLSSLDNIPDNYYIEVSF